MVTEKTVMKGTNQDPVFLASVSVTDTQFNADNVGTLVKKVEHYKERMHKMKNTLVQEIREGGELKRKMKQLSLNLRDSKRSIKF